MQDSPNGPIFTERIHYTVGSTRETFIEKYCVCPALSQAPLLIVSHLILTTSLRGYLCHLHLQIKKLGTERLPRLGKVPKITQSGQSWDPDTSSLAPELTYLTATLRCLQ